ncbi:MAG: metal ABC transporter solute-binding protein, Zn/Mn family [Parachlamydiaceae bacterium]
MNKRLIVLLIILCACRSQGSDSTKAWMESNDTLKVLTTTAMVKDVVEGVAKGRVSTIALIKGELDPHSYQLVKGDDEKLKTADIIFANGLGLEHGASLQHYLQTSPKVIELGNLIFRDHPHLAIFESGQVDPHIWMDIELWAMTVPYIVNLLSEQDPDHEDEYRANGEKLMEKMIAQHQEVKRLIQEIPERKRFLVTSHDAFNYFARAYLAEKGEVEHHLWQKRFAAPEGLAPDSQLNPYDIQLIIDHLSRYNIRVLFPESNVSRDSIKKIVSAGKEKGLDVVIADDYLYGDAMGRPGSDGDTYLKMIMHNALTITRHLKKNP